MNMARKLFKNMTLREKYLAIWDRLPKEVRVAIYVTLSGAITALVDYLTSLELNDALQMAIINVIIVLLQNRRKVVTSRL